MLSFLGFKGLKGYHGQGKVRERQKFFKVREKSQNFLSGKWLKTKRKLSMASQGIFNTLVRGNPEGATCMWYLFAAV